MVDDDAIRENKSVPPSEADEGTELAPLPIPPPSKESRYLNIKSKPSFRPLPGSADERSDQVSHQ